MTRISTVTIVIVSLISIMLLWYTLPPELTYNERWSKTNYHIFPVDLDDSGEHELWSNANGYQIDIMDWKYEHHFASFPVPYLKSRGVFPIKTGSLDSIYLVQQRITPDSASYDLLLRQRNRPEIKLIRKNWLVFTGVDRNKDGRYYENMGFFDKIYNRNGKPLWLITVNSGFDAGPRGMIAIDPTTYRPVWHYYVGPQIKSLMTADVDRDGIKEIIFSTYAPSNGAIYNGFTDDSCYVFMLNAAGKKLWHRPFGPYWSGVMLDTADVDGDGHNELFAVHYSVRKRAEIPNCIYILNPRTGKTIHSRTVTDQFTENYEVRDRCTSYDFTGNGRDEIVIGNTDGTVRMYDAELDVIKQSQSVGSKIAVLFLARLLGGDERQIVALAENNRMLVLNRDLKIIGEIKFPALTVIMKVSTSQKDYLLCTPYYERPGEVTKMIEFRRASIPERILSPDYPYVKWILLSWFTIVLVIVARAVIFSHYSRRLLLQFLNNTTFNEQYLVIDASGTCVVVGKAWADMINKVPDQIRGKPIRHFWSLEGWSPFQSAFQYLLDHKPRQWSFEIGNPISYRMVSAYFVLLKWHCIFLHDVKEQEFYRHLQVWAPVAQRLAHGIKNPLTTIKLNAEELHQAVKDKFNTDIAEMEDYFSNILSQVTKLKRMSDGFMHFTDFTSRELIPCDLNDMVMQAVNNLQLSQSNDIRFDYELGDYLPQVLLNPQQFNELMEIILINSIESMPNGGRIIISTSRVDVFPERDEHLNHPMVELQIRDTGCGIPSELLDKVMQPYVSVNKQNGTGLGLAIAAKIVDLHSGTIDIYSEQHVGTTVTLRFRCANEADDATGG